MKIERLISKQPVAEQLQNLYDRGYYYGETSGYSTEGYPHDHPDWKAWCDFLLSLRPSGGRLIDLGCAYGYLAEEWRGRGFPALGLDISPFALSRGQCRHLALSTLQRLPLPCQSADIVCLFDVLEHLHDPLTALREAQRILKPQGLLIGATPDAPFFERHEETHVFERPASFWVAALRELGMQCRFRFSEVDYNFQFLAGSESQLHLLDRLQHDYFGDDPDILRSQGPLAAVLRPGWGPLQEGTRKPLQWPARIYLLNPLSSPLEVRISLQTSCPDWASLRVRWNSQVLADIRPGSQPVGGEFELPEVLLPSGGHHLFLESSPAARWEVSEVRLQARSGDSAPLRRGLPFDLYQRYRMAADAARVLEPDTLLDMGGYIGDADGHLAVAADFFAPGPSRQTPQVLTCDERLCDHPDHLSSGDPLLQGATFDMVVCLDVLEHVPPDRRSDFLDRLLQLAGRWIVLAGPFASPQVEEAEEALRSRLMAARRFLQEHAQYGLPELEPVSRHFQKKGCSVLQFP
ncbi:MAG TPA: methyltransferase domain-containing protein, partial [Acidobacteriota bacterium]|nr:methyltransferase domain-containing protein [Acidobacteriota bacterium]